MRTKYFIPRHEAEGIYVFPNGKEDGRSIFKNGNLGCFTWTQNEMNKSETVPPWNGQTFAIQITRKEAEKFIGNRKQFRANLKYIFRRMS